MEDLKSSPKGELSLVVICGDAGTLTLARMLNSVLRRSSGPMVDEVVIAFNGSEPAGLRRALVDARVNFLTPDDATGYFLWHDDVRVTVKTFAQVWKDDFAGARNEAHSHATGRWHLFLDTDDVFPGAEAPPEPSAEELAEFKTAGVDPARLKAGTLKDWLASLPADINAVDAAYHYFIGGSEEVLYSHPKIRIVRWADGFAWKGDGLAGVATIHENLFPTGANRFVVARNAGLFVRHYPTESTTARIKRNAAILAKAVAVLEARGEAPDHRVLYNLATFCLDAGEQDKAMALLGRACAAAAAIPEESIHYRKLLARIGTLHGRDDVAMAAALEIVHLAPDRKDGYLALMELAFRRNDAARVLAYYPHWSVSRQAEGLGQARLEETVYPHVWTALAALDKGDIAQAARVTTLEAVVAASATDVWVKAAIDSVEAAVEADRLETAGMTLLRWHAARGDRDRAWSAFDALPPLERRRIEAERVLAACGDPKEDDDFATSEERLAPAPAGQKVIAIFAPHFNEVWGPEWPTTRGIGGSEEAIVYLAPELVKRGYEVQVFGPAEQDERVRVIDGVQWRRLADLDLASDPFDVFIAHRAPWIVQHRTAPGRVLVWHHDHTYTANEWTPARAVKAEHLFVSQWQAAVLGNALRETGPAGEEAARRVLGALIGNGVPAAQAPELTEASERLRNPKRVIYASQPIRGLSRLLEIWPDVLKDVPDAELHTFYGKHTNSLSRYPQVVAELAKVEGLLKDAQRVTDHGRVAQPVLMEEMRRSGVWAYPCITGETRIAMPCDHREYPYGVPIEKLVGKAGFPVWCLDEKEKRFTLGTVERVWETKRVSELTEIQLDDGTLLRCTPEHPVMDFDGDWHRADEIGVGTRLMALHYRYDVSIKDYNGDWTAESRAVGAWKEGRPLRSDEHVDHHEVSLDNSPDRLSVMTRSAHMTKTHKGRKSRRAAEANRMQKYKAWQETADGKRRMTENGRARSTKFWAEMKAQPSEVQKAFYARRARTLKTTMRKIMDENGPKAMAILAGQAKTQETRRTKGKNHKVVAVRAIRVEVPIPVYDMTIREHHNFVANGVVVHNCSYPEVSSIAGLRAHAAGCTPVFVGRPEESALSETMLDHDAMVTEAWDEGGKEAFTRALIRVLSTPDELVTRRARREAILEASSWSAVADRLVTLLETKWT